MAKQKLKVLIDQNEIGKTGKIIAGILLIVFTVLPVVFMIGLWPNKMPEPKGPEFYKGGLFHITLADSNAPANGLHVNTIMFLLVALAGFIGSMIHLSTSFTNYVGSEKFKRSWILWYFVKPFTAAGVAILFYLVLKAGLLNFDGAGGANPFGIVILSALAGLFTDKATLKLEEIFTIIFKPKDERPGKIDENTIRIKGFNPKKLIAGENTIIIAGEGLDKHSLVIKINEEIISGAEIKAETILFKYKIPDMPKPDSGLKLSILDENGTVIYSGAFELDETPGATTKKSTPGTMENADNLIDDEEELEEVEDFVKG